MELSKIMRFVLYEGSKQKVPLRQELIFLDNYIQLMRMRVADKKVDITVDIPQAIPDREIPPLMMITFVENAFKHGVSYQHESFIEVKVSIDGDSLLFSCRNSKAEIPNQEKGGVGLANVRKRLNLLYDHSYSLSIRDAADVYAVELTIPILLKSPETNTQT